MTFICSSGSYKPGNYNPGSYNPGEGVCRSVCVCVWRERGVILRKYVGELSLLQNCIYGVEEFSVRIKGGYGLLTYNLGEGIMFVDCSKA